MRRVLYLLIILAGAALLVLRAEPFAPVAALEMAGDTVGRTTSFRVLGTDRGTGLADIRVLLVPPAGAPLEVAHEQYPRTTWRGSGIHSALVSGRIDATQAKVPEGPARIEVYATDYSWLARFRRAPRLARDVTIDVTPPALSVVNEERVGRVGGSECVVYRVGPDAARSGVRVGDRFFRGAALFADTALRAALFALPQDVQDLKPEAVAFDAGGNERAIPIGLTIKPQRFAEKTLPITDEFLARKVPELLKANGLESGDDLVAGYLRINRELRVATERRVREICRTSHPAPLWQGPLLRLPNSAPLSGFADRRTYTYQGKAIDQQTHLGFDLASLRASPVPAAEAGRVAFTGVLGIYGDTVILDHGLGLFTLYGHLSEITVTSGATVRRGDTVGKTGETGLAGGDHLHFSVMINGVHVDPVEWWDGHWIQDHVERRLAAFPRAAKPASTADAR